MATLNIRFDNPGDGVNAWIHRKEIIAMTLLDKRADLVGFQEVLRHQRDELAQLMPGYGFIGVGREDGRDKGESCPVAYCEARLKCKDWGTIWLSPNPLDTGVAGWDAALPRTMTWARFSDRIKGGDFFFLNTHFDHMGDTARTESARQIARFITEHCSGLPVILAGDFNCQEEEAPYLFLTGGAGQSEGLTDTGVGRKLKNGQASGTFNGFGTVSEPERIDFIFTNGRWDPVWSEVLQVRHGETYISDHYPVVTKLRMK